MLYGRRLSFYVLEIAGLVRSVNWCSASSCWFRELHALKMQPIADQLGVCMLGGGTCHAMAVVHANDELLEYPSCMGLLQPRRSLSEYIFVQVAALSILHHDCQMLFQQRDLHSKAGLASASLMIMTYVACKHVMKGYRPWQAGIGGSDGVAALAQDIHQQQGVQRRRVEWLQP